MSKILEGKRFGALIIFCVLISFIFISLSYNYKKYNTVGKIDLLFEAINKNHEQVDAHDLKDIYADVGNNFYLLNDDYQGHEDKFSSSAAVEEVEWLFNVLREEYGLYNFFGGDETFIRAKKDIIKEILDMSSPCSITVYLDILSSHLNFINDSHFILGNKVFDKNYILYGYIDTCIDYKNGWYWIGGKKILSVNGKTPSKYIKRSLDTNGDLAWYIFTMDIANTAVNVNIEYSDSIESIKLVPIKDSKLINLESFLNNNQDDILYLKFDRMVFKEEGYGPWKDGDTKIYEDIISSANKVRNYLVAIIDLTDNTGGNGTLPGEWFKQFTGQDLSPNYSSLCLNPSLNWLKYVQDENSSKISLNEIYTEQGFEYKDNYYTKNPRAQFLDAQGPILIILTSRDTASAAEGFVDMIHNLKNALVIGQNTAGCLVGTATYLNLYLPKSGLYFQFGNQYNKFNADYFNESIGFEPDLYLIGEDADKRLSLFLKKVVGSLGKLE